MRNSTTYVIPAKAGISERKRRFRVKPGMTAILVLLALNLCAQDSTQVEMADGMRASGKIYVVITVLAILFIGIVVYLVSLDKKISKLEKEREQEK